MTPKEAIEKILEWANASHAYLSNLEGYPRGYRDGITQAKEIVLSILSNTNIKQNKSVTQPNDCIIYKGRRFKTRLVDCGNNGIVTVALNGLWEAIKEDYDKRDEQAIAIDNSICYYCTQKEFNLPDLELNKLIYE